MQDNNKRNVDAIKQEFENEIKELRAQLKKQSNTEKQTIEENLKKEFEEIENSLRKTQQSELDLMKEKLQKEKEKVYSFVGKDNNYVDTYPSWFREKFYNNNNLHLLKQNNYVKIFCGFG